MSKKMAAELSVNVIIVAAIALAVLVVLFAIFTGRLGSFSTGVAKTANCENSCKALGMQKGTDSVDEDPCKTDKTRAYVPGTYSDVTSGVCCCTR